MENKILNVKDLINVGLFSVLILVFTFVCGFVGYFPVTMPFLPFIIGVVTGPVYMLYSTKITKPGMIIIQQFVLGLVFLATGHGIFVIGTLMICAIIAEFVIRKDNYTNLNAKRIAFSITPMGVIGNFVPLLISRDKVYQRLVMHHGVEFANKFMSVVTYKIMIPSILLAAVGGFIGCTIGIHLLKKHFVKAGMLKEK